MIRERLPIAAALLLCCAPCLGAAAPDPAPTSRPTGQDEAAALSVEQLLRDAAKYDGKRVTVSGEHGWNFEISRMGDLWIEASSEKTKMQNPPADYWRKGGKSPVTATGVFHAAPGARYGYMGGFRYKLDAERIVFGPPRPAAPQPAYGEAVDGLQAGLLPSAVQAEHQWDLQMVAWLRNVGQKDIQYNTRLIHPVLTLDVTDAAGKRMLTVPPPTPDSPDVARWHMAKLAPGGEAKYFLTMNIFSPPLPEGVYNVQFKFGQVRSGTVQVRIGEPPAASRPAVAADGQGIEGQVVKLAGDFMPGPGPARGSVTPLGVPVHVFRGKLTPLAAPDPRHPALVRIVQAGKDGRFRLALPPGTYTVVAEIGGRLYLNLYEGGGQWGSVTVKPGRWTQVRIEDSSEATF